MAQPTPTPIFTLVRASATAKNPKWYETNAGDVVVSQGHEPTPPPQWHTSIHEKVNIALPVRVFDDSDSSDSEEKEESWPGYGDIEEVPQPAHTENEVVHLHNARLWGLAASPGGGSTAVLMSLQSAYRPDRGGFYNAQSTVLFGWAPGPLPLASAPSTASSLRLSTEGRMWEWMYGAGPGVPRITASSVPGEMDTEALGRDRVRAHFRGLVEVQKCIFCGKDMVLWEDEKHFSCAEDHVYGDFSPPNTKRLGSPVVVGFSGESVSKLILVLDRCVRYDWYSDPDA